MLLSSLSPAFTCRSLNFLAITEMKLWSGGEASAVFFVLILLLLGSIELLPLLSFGERIFLICWSGLDNFTYFCLASNDGDCALKKRVFSLNALATLGLDGLPVALGPAPTFMGEDANTDTRSMTEVDAPELVLAEVLPVSGGEPVRLLLLDGGVDSCLRNC